jgi:hypothetical protein
MKKKIMMVEESLYEFSKRDKNKKRGIDAPDEWKDLEDEDEVVDDINVDTSDMETADEIDIDDNNTIAVDDIKIALNNELKIPEFNRRTLTFRLSGDLEKTYNGVPMAKMEKGEAFLFKLDDGKIKKIFLKDIIVEQKKGSSKNYTLNE